MGQTVTKYFNGQQMTKLTVLKTFDPRGLPVPYIGAIYMYMSIICFKIFFSKTAWPMKAKFDIEPP